MSKELRALAIVFGILGGLLILGIAGIAIAFTIFAKHLAAQPRDPAALLRTAHKIVSFDVPPGYELVSATDLGVSVSALMRPVGRRSSFRLSLQGSRFLSSPEFQAGGAALGISIAERMLGCAPGPESEVGVSVHGAHRMMHVVHCTMKNGVRTRAEVVQFPGSVASATLSAIGTADDFDDAAVRELLASIR